MSILLFKALNHIIRTLARPIINRFTTYKKKYLKENKLKKGPVLVLIRFFTCLGQFTNRTNNKINKKIFNIKSIDVNSLLPEDKALEKGIETFSEIIIYIILLSIPIYEFKRVNDLNYNKELEKKTLLKNMHHDVIQINNRNEVILTELNKKIEDLRVKIEFLNRINQENNDYIQNFAPEEMNNRI